MSIEVALQNIADALQAVAEQLGTLAGSASVANGQPESPESTAKRVRRTNAEIAAAKEAEAAARATGSTPPAAASAAAAAAKAAAEAGQKTAQKTAQQAADALHDQHGKAEAAAKAAKDAAATPQPATFEQVTTAIMAVNKGKGRPTAEALCARFGVKRVSELKAETWPQFLIDAARVVDGSWDPIASASIPAPEPDDLI